ADALAANSPIASRIFRRWPTAKTPISFRSSAVRRGQDVEVDAVVAKRLLVRLQAEATQPLSDVHFASARAPFGSRLRSRYAEPVTPSGGRSGSAGPDSPDRISPSARPAA